MCIDPASITFSTGDGIALAGRVYEPPGSASTTALVTGGVGVPQRIYRPLLEWLAAQGIRCLSFDYRGCGESRHTPNGVATASLTAWAKRDAVAALEHAEQAWAEPVVLLAHSFGGQLLAIADAMKRVRAVVMVASQVGNARYWDGLDRLKIAAFWYLLLPVFSLFYEITPRWLGSRLPRGAAREWACWGRQPDWLFSVNPDAGERLRNFPKPILSFSVDDDDLAPPRAAVELIRRFNPDIMDARRLLADAFGIDRIGHYGVFQREELLPVWREIHGFLSAPAPGTSG